MSLDREVYYQLYRPLKNISFIANELISQFYCYKPSDMIYNLHLALCDLPSLTSWASTAVEPDGKHSVTQWWVPVLPYWVIFHCSFQQLCFWLFCLKNSTLCGNTHVSHLLSCCYNQRCVLSFFSDQPAFSVFMPIAARSKHQWGVFAKLHQTFYFTAAFVRTLIKSDE